MTTLKIQVTVEITEEQIKDVLVTALEGGSNYWYELDIKAPKGTPYEDYITQQVISGESIPVYDIEDEDEDRVPLGFINLENMERGFYLYSKDRDLVYLLDGGDAEDADMWFQFTVMGEIVYG